MVKRDELLISKVQTELVKRDGDGDIIEKIKREYVTDKKGDLKKVEENILKEGE